MSRRAWSATLLAIAASSGCVVERYEAASYRRGTATIHWAIASRADASVCAEHGAAFVDVVLREELGEVIADDLAACGSFATRYVLRRGWYAATLTLLDDARRPLALPQDTGGFYVAPARDTSIAVSFLPHGAEITSVE
jgi:hypothetical protein